MANKEIRTTLILRNDTSANWELSTLVLKKGEVGFDTDKLIFKVGDGSKTWKEIGTSFVSFADVQEAIAEATKNLHTTDVYQVEIELGADKIAALQGVAESPVKGDIGIIKEKLSPAGKIQYTSYVYDGENWAAMDGNYDAENVYFQKDLTITANIGVQTIPSSGSKTLDTTGKNLKQVFDMIVASEKNPSTSQPSVSLTLKDAKAYEVGTKFTPYFTISFNKGSYTYGPDTKVTATYSTTDTNDHIFTGASGVFGEFTVEESTQYSATTTATYTDGEVPVTNLGNPYEAGKIVAGTAKATSAKVTGFRGWFYGYYNGDSALADASKINSDQLRAFGVRTSFPSQVTTTKMQQMFFAAPKGKEASLSISNAVNGAPLTVNKTSVMVEGANGYTAAEYDLFYVANAVAESGESKWNIK